MKNTSNAVKNAEIQWNDAFYGLDLASCLAFDRLRERRMTKWRLKLLGGFELRDGADTRIDVRGRKLQGLIAYLAFSPGRHHGREALANLLWGNRFEAQARQSLRQALSAFRKLIEGQAPELLDANDDTIALRPEMISVDIVAFERLIAEGNFEDAATTYGGEFLQELEVRSDSFDAWQLEERVRLRDLACTVWETLFEKRLLGSDSNVTIEAAKRLVALDPLRETSQRMLMRTYAQSGRRSEAMQQYHAFAELLRRELDVSPDAETNQLFEEIKDLREAPGSGPTQSPLTLRVEKPRVRHRQWAVSAAVLIGIILGSVLWMNNFTAPAPPGEGASGSGSGLTLSDKPSIAVLPFSNMSGDATQEYFADGMTEDIITGLSKFGLFFVVSRNSTFAYKDASPNLKDVARDLGVQYVLEGSVRKSGDHVRINVQLIDAIADKHVWAEKFDRELKDVFQIQDEITESIVTSVAPEFLSAEMRRAQRKDARNLDAWDAFMRGYWRLLRFTRDDNAMAQRLLAKAIDLDPTQANYHGLQAVTHVMDALYGWGESRTASFRMALDSSDSALALNDQDTVAIRAAGLVHFFSKNHDVALDYFRRAVEANSNEAENHALLGAALGVAGDYDASLKQFEIAFLLSPRDAHIATWYNYLGIAAFVTGQDEKAAEWSMKTVQANPRFPGGYRTLAASYGNLGQNAEAENARQKLQELLPNLTLAQLRESLPYFKNPNDLDRYLDGLRKSGLPN